MYDVTTTKALLYTLATVMSFGAMHKAVNKNICFCMYNIKIYILIIKVLVTISSPFYA